MKKVITVFLIAAMSLAIAGVFIFNKADHTASDGDKSVASEKASNADKTKPTEVKKTDAVEKGEEKLAKKISSKGKDTLLIYMVGSDLESRSGAGTDDLREIEESGINLKKANVVVYAGGAQNWHNDNMYKGKNTILQLGKKGFEPIEKMDSSSMGDADTLLKFLDYSYKNFPSDSYSLIMWDHGNGPIIGYGKDMLFDNDSLTLSEMDEALKASPFGGDLKFEWVGFDACLMSSAELVCIWDDYAKYLVASQEVEPSFGWNYSFLNNFGEIETTVLTKNIVDEYVSACNAYYKKRGYDDRDTTLACMDLAYAGELENAINSLFSRADNDVYTQYNKLVSKRVATRALGRASTGSEYDLIDLKDMAEQLSDVYPNETKKIRDAVEKTVVKNGTNTQGCCGLSLYYPFYNKYYYEDSWAEAYGKIGLFSNYRSYLNKYQEIWLKDDKLDEYASSNTPFEDTRSGFEFDIPGKTVSKKYNLQLTKEQNENYAEAKVYILERRGQGQYHVVFSDNNVINRNGVLSYNFEGKGIFVKNKFCDYYLPVTTGYDSVGDINRYSLKIRVKNIEKNELQDALFNVSLNKKTGVVNLSSIKPYINSASLQDLAGGKSEELNINDWDYIFPMKPNYIYLQRYDNGVVKPIKEWVGNGIVGYMYFYMKDDIDFVYAALDNWNYSLVFEITDTQNNKYCSEPLDIVVESDGKEIYKPKDIDLEWTTGERIKIFETDDSVLYLKKAIKRNEIAYNLEATNTSNRTIEYSFDDIVINGNIKQGYASLTVNPGKTEEGLIGIELGDLTDVGTIDEVFRISGTLSVAIKSEKSAAEKIKTIEKNQRININISEDALEKNLKSRFPKYEFMSPFYGAFSEEQEVFNNEKIKITLCNFGKAEQSGRYVSSGTICIENLTDEEQIVTINSYSINGYAFDSGGGGILNPKCKKYHNIYISEQEMRANNITAIETFKVKLSLYKNREQYYDKFTEEGLWVDIKLKTETAGNVLADEREGKVIFDKNNVKILITEYGFTNNGPQWKIVVGNESDTDISVVFGDENSISSSYLVSGGLEVGAHSKKRGTISIYTHEEVPNEIPTRIYIMDYYGTEILDMSDEMITFCVEPLVVPKEEAVIDWTSNEEQVIDSRNGVAISIKQYDWYGDLTYALEFENKRKEQADFEIYDIIINGDIVIKNKEYISVNAGEAKIGVKIPDFCAITDMGMLDEIHSISFKIKETSRFVSQYALNNHLFTVNIKDAAVINNIAQIYKPIDLTVPYLDAWASKQEILCSDKLKIEFIGLGKGYQMTTWNEVYYEGRYGFCVENLSSETQSVTIEGVSVNDAFIAKKQEMKIPPKCKAYFSGKIDDYDMELCNITSIERMVFGFSVTENGSSPDNPELLWIPIKLGNAGKMSNETVESNSVIFDKNGVKVYFDSYKADTYGESTDSIWEFTILNGTTDDISLQMLDLDGITVNSAASDIRVGAKQYRKIQIRFYKIVEDLEFWVVVKDFYGTQTKSKSDAIIKINNKAYINKGE